MHLIYKLLGLMKQHINSGVLPFLLRFNFTLNEVRPWSKWRLVSLMPPNYSISSSTKCDLHLSYHNLLMVYVISLLLNGKSIKSCLNSITYLSSYEDATPQRSQGFYAKSRSFITHTIELEYIPRLPTTLSRRDLLTLVKCGSGIQ